MHTAVIPDKQQISFLPESGHKVHCGPAQDEGFHDIGVAFSNFIYAVCRPHVSQFNFIFNLKVIVISKKEKTQIGLLVLFLKC